MFADVNTVVEGKLPKDVCFHESVVEARGAQIIGKFNLNSFRFCYQSNMEGRTLFDRIRCCSNRNQGRGK